MPNELMKAAVLKAPRTFELQNVPVPAPRSGQVRIRLEGTGVCGSNLEAWQGQPWFHYPLGAGASGHEGWGYIDAIGTDVHGFALNDRVAAITANGFAEYDVVPAHSVIKLPSALHDKAFPGEA